MLVSKSISLFGLERQAELIGDDLLKITSETINSINYIRGKETIKFEESFAKFIGHGSGVSVANGTDAIFLALKGLNIGPGDEIIVPNFTFIATWFAALNTGATIVGVDVEDDGLLSLEKTIEAITSQTKCIILVHLYGKMVNVRKFKENIPSSIFILEDAAQSHECFLDDQRMGEFSNAVAFSFYPTKTIGCFGDGGYIYSLDQKFVNHCKLLSNYGSSKKYYNKILGFNSRLDELQAAYLSYKLRYIPKWVENRQKNAKKLLEVCDGQIVRPLCDANLSGHALHLFVVEVQARHDLIKMLINKKIDYGIHYPIIPIRQECFTNNKDLLKRVINKGCNKSLKLSENVLSLPCHQHMTETEVDKVSEVLKQFIGF